MIASCCNGKICDVLGLKFAAKITLGVFVLTCMVTILADIFKVIANFNIGILARLHHLLPLGLLLLPLLGLDLRHYPQTLQRYLFPKPLGKL